MKDKKNNKLRIVLDVNESLANAIRRCVNKIPILAIEDVEIHKNDSALYDEILAHRLGLIPIKSNRKLEEIKDGEKDSVKNQIQIVLKKTGPCTVYSDDLKGDIEIIYEQMPLTLLDKNQEIEIIAFAKLGVGEKHAKYSPGLAYYRNITEIKIKNLEKFEKNLEKFEKKLLNEKSNLKKGDVLLCTEDEDYIESIFDKEDVEITFPENKLVLFIESWGQISPQEIFNESVKKLNSEIKSVVKKIK
jgi:DNA-directed RNA polymerase subunit D